MITFMAAQACDCKLKVIHLKRIVAVLVFVLLTQSVGQNFAFIDPALEQGWEGQKSVIVTAVDTNTAQLAIESTGSISSSLLPIIDAAVANLTYTQLQRLTHQPGVISIIENKSIETSSSLQFNADGDDEDDDLDRNNWGSDRRRFIASHYIGNKIKILPLVLPNGQIFVVSEKGDGMILSQEGVTLHNFSLNQGKKFITTPIAGNDGTIYIAGEDKYVLALNEDGSVRWSYQTKNKIKGGIALDDAAGHLIVLDEKGELTAISLTSGAELWTIEFDDKKAGKAQSPPLIAADGTIYAALEKGHVVAISSSGQHLWTYEVEKGREFKFAPVLGEDGTLFVFNKKEDLVALNPDGTVRFEFEPDKKITAPPIVTSDGVLILPASEKMYVLNPDGSVRFVFDTPKKGKFKTSPLLSPDQTIIYIALKEKYLFALDTASGNLLWEFNTEEKIEAAPLIESNGDIHVTSKNGRYVILSPEGTILYTRLMPGELKMSPVMGLNGQYTYVVTEEYTVEAIALLDDQWLGGEFATPTGDYSVWNFVSVPTIDVGADVLQDDYLQDGSPITGEGITIAVIDSGIEFDNDIQNQNWSHINDIYWGQADFVGDGVCQSGHNGQQQSGYCWTSTEHSYDPYGHGTHMAGIIWNNFIDVDTEVSMGIAPNASLLSIRVLDDEGAGTYADIIEGIQFVIDHKDTYETRVINLSLSGEATVPYFVDPLNRAVESAWAEGIVVVAAAGNSGDGPQTITVPGNDPYIITVGAIHSNQTPGYWADDTIPSWSASGPTHDGFIKPDILAPGTDIISFVNSEGSTSSYLAENYPHFSESSSLFRMHGTSTSTAVTSGVVALMLEKHPNLTPDQVKFRLMSTAKTAVTAENEPTYSIFRQGLGRIWAPDAILGDFENQNANQGLDILNDLAHPWQEGDSPDPAINPDLAHHYQGPILTKLSDDETAVMYYVPELASGNPVILGIANIDGGYWLTLNDLNNSALTFDNGNLWDQNTFWSGGAYAWGGGAYAWGGGAYAWGGGAYAWGGGAYAWGGGAYAWGGSDWSAQFSGGFNDSGLIITDEELE